MFTYDLDAASAISQVRLLIGDTVDDGHLFEDAEIEAFLSLGGDSTRLAAATALEVMAANQVMVLKVMTLYGFSTNGAAVAAELRQQAESLRSQDASGNDDPGGLFDWAEMVVDPFSRREVLRNRAVRGAL